MSVERRGLLRLVVGAGAASVGGAAAGSPSAECRSAASASDSDPLDAELARLRRVDPALVAWDEVDRIRLELDAPQALAAGGSGRLWVVGDRALLLYAARQARGGPGQLVKRWALTERPSCVASSADGRRVYVGLGDRVEARGADGGRAVSWASGGADSFVASLAPGESEVLLADAGRKTVLRCDTEGRLLRPLVDDPRHFVVPGPYLDVVRAGDGVLWAANPGRHRLESFTPQGRPLRVIGAAGTGTECFCGCCNPTHVACLPDGRLVTSEKGLPRVKVLQPTGVLDSVVVAGDALPPLAVGLDLSVDERGRVLVLVPAERAVRVYAPRSGERRHA